MVFRCTNKSIESQAASIAVPFGITNVKLTDVGDGKKSFTADNQGKGGKAFILKNIIDKQDRFEAELVQPEDAKSILKTVLSYEGREETLFYIHGWKTSCRHAINQTVKMNNFDSKKSKKFLVIPVFWAATWNNISYADERKEYAPEAGQDFHDLLLLLSTTMNNCPVKKSVMAHSMGNYVLRIIAEKNTLKPMFEDIFMVAPDVRWDLFDEEFNKATDETITTIQTSSGTTATVKTFIDGNACQEDGGQKSTTIKTASGTTTTVTTFPDDKTNENRGGGGLKIASLAKNKVHVLYYEGDKALLGRQAWHGARGMEQSALGRCAGYSINRLHPLLGDKVAFHYSGEMQKLVGLKHSYHDSKEAMKYYENPKPNSIIKKAWFFVR